MNYKVITIKVKAKAIDALVFHLGEIGIDSVEIVDNNISKEDLDKMYNNVNGLPSPGEYSLVRCYFDVGIKIDGYVSKINDIINHISEFIDVGETFISTKEVEDDYLNNWKKYYKVVEIGELAIVPEWESYDGEKVAIKIEPAYAFGSGSHETTIISLELMQKIDLKGKSIVDVGCGSGILSIAANELGASEIVAVDLDELAIKSTNNNLKLNDMSECVKVMHGNLLDKVNGKFDVIVSNIIFGVLVSMKEDLKSRLKRGGTIVLSGMLATQKEQFIEKFGKDFKIVEILTMGEWQGAILKYE